MLLPILAPLLLWTSFPAPQAGEARSLRIGGSRVGPAGVLVRADPHGLTTLDGPAAHLRGSCDEWFGVEFLDGEDLVEAVGCGRSGDWAGRPRVRELGFADLPDGAVRARAMAGDLFVETRFELDADGPYLLGHVRFQNRGARVVSRLLYTREWRQRPGVQWSFPPDFVPRREVDPGICRLVWMMDDMEPGATAELRFSYRIGDEFDSTGVPEVPLQLYTDERWPGGFRIGETNGVSFGDYDADGFTDLFALESGRLFRNRSGTTWDLAANLDAQVGLPGLHYGSSFGDYDNDGLSDIATEPRTGCAHLLANLGNTLFEDAMADPQQVDVQPCAVPAETICWGDVDDDGDLDLFLPVYPPSAGGPGNFFFENLGPVGPGGRYRLVESVEAAGLDNPPRTARPEGAQFVDVDGDGDMDLYSNGTLYRNVSTDHPAFQALTRSASGIGLRRRLDEGAAFFDYDLDGDFDLFVVYNGPGVVIWENRGDGTFFQETSLVESPFTGLTLGLSAADWDNDGDIDFTTRNVFRRNMLMETGERAFRVAQSGIPAARRRNATPAWADWDRDGDLDCALGNWMSIGWFYENVHYGPGDPPGAKPYLRVRVVRDSDLAPRGLETEYGASVEVVVRGSERHRRFRKFVASSAGYLNQNDYTLHFALPPGEDPQAPASGIRVDVVVDFPGRPERGLLRVDRHVNPALGDIELASLVDREITVYRSGRVIVDGVSRPPRVPTSGARLTTTTGGLAAPEIDRPPPKVVRAEGDDHWVGIELSTARAKEPIRISEVLLDGVCDEPVQVGEVPAQLLVWDVTDSDRPVPVFSTELPVLPRNQRVSALVDFKLGPGRTYRIVARVVQLRATPIQGPVRSGPLEVRGGLSFSDPDPASGTAVRSASLDPEAVYLALRFVAAPESGRVDRR